jgi:hypothetical protein
MVIAFTSVALPPYQWANSSHARRPSSNIRYSGSAIHFASISGSR